MKKLFILAVIIFSFFFVSSPTFACQPCANTLNLEETIKKADLIVVGQKVADGPRSDFGEGYGGSDWIKVKIIETLKGSAPSAKIKVNSWDTMCPYGIIVGDSRSYLMLLQRRTSSEESYQYDAVNFGCAETSYLVENNQIDFKEQKITLETFASKYGLLNESRRVNGNSSNNGIQTKDLNKNNSQTINTNRDNTQAIDTTNNTNAVTQKQSSALYYIVIALATLVILIFVMLKKGVL